MNQNIYDNDAFFEGYKSLRMNDSGLNGALEMPALHALLPDLSGLKVLDLGCGFGHFARQARAQGADSVLGVDISMRMLEEAGKSTDDAAITYVHSSIESFTASPQTFDLAVSSLALHYVEDYAGALARVFEVLKPEGLFAFSVEHPMCTAYPAGWIRNDQGEPVHWPVDKYGDEGLRNTHWFVDGVVKYHRTIESHVQGLLNAGFRLESLLEPAPSPEILAQRPSLKTECRRPPFLQLAASRPVTT
jgi:SAM-dependent methyltransferase